MQLSGQLYGPVVLPPGKEPPGFAVKSHPNSLKKQRNSGDIPSERYGTTISSLGVSEDLGNALSLGARERIFESH